MEDKLYSKVATELTEIFKHMDIGLLYRIPQKLRDKLEEIKDKNYNFHYESSKPLKEQVLLPETLDFFSSLYIEFCCDQDEKMELIRKCRANDLL